MVLYSAMLFELVANGDAKALILALDGRDLSTSEVGIALCMAARMGKAKLVSIFLQAGVSPDGVSPHHPLDFAVAFVDVLAMLINAGAKALTGDTAGKTLLHLAAAIGSAESVEYLLERGYDSNATDENGWTPLHWATKTGEALARRVSGLDLLLKHGADPNRQTTQPALGDTIGGETALFIACMRGKHVMVKRLLAKGADPNLFNVVGEHSCFALARCRAIVDVGPIARTLIRKRADLGRQNLEGKTAFQIAVENNRLDVIDILKLH